MPASDSPHSFDWIEFGRVRRQENTYQTVLILYEKVSQISCLVPTGIVQNKIQLPLCMLKKIMEKIAEGLGIECGDLFGQKTSCFQVECPNPDEPKPKTISSQGSGIGDQGEKWLSPDP